MGWTGTANTLERTLSAQNRGESTSSNAAPNSNRKDIIKKRLGYDDKGSGSDGLVPSDSDSDSDDEPSKKKKRDSEQNLLGSRRSAKKKSKKEAKESPTGIYIYNQTQVCDYWTNTNWLQYTNPNEKYQIVSNDEIESILETLTNSRETLYTKNPFFMTPFFVEVISNTCKCEYRILQHSKLMFWGGHFQN